MSNKLKAITTKAKALYKTGKYSKWTEAIKAASKSIGATKKAAPKKKSATKKKTATKKGSTHKDTKSHNVNIKVVSGWKKGSTLFREKQEKKVANHKNIKVSRNPKGGIYKPGAFSHFSTLSGLFDTTVIKDLDSLKKEYFKLAKKYHPDAGGTTAQFQELGKEYDKLLKAILSGSTLNTEQKNNEVVIDKAIRDVIDSIISLQGINIELLGKWLWVSGDTYPVHKQLKAAGLVFIKKDKVPYWVYKGVESSSRGGASLEEIKAKYGVQTFTPRSQQKLSGLSHKIKKDKLKRSLIRLTKALNKRPV
jgi:hypothetical protein